ncbi:MAG: DUF4062 domain-containing protein [Candidatus Cloacimonetes bacterium]|nr:DUF4062 domain-containing protein [Candidatus Cloacimonadota bacterium]
MPQQTKIFRVFVSSTFDDMKMERNLLMNEVFPKLEKFCLGKGARFQAIDLRWGVNEESQRNQKTMEICINEIKRCQRLSPRPNFLILLGNRYGWQPIPNKIPQREMDLILPLLSENQKEVVCWDETNDNYRGWYRLDTNAVPPDFILQPRGKQYNEYKAWESEENKIRTILREAVNQIEIAPEERVKYFTSATHQEILHGALNRSIDLKGSEEHVYACSRRIINIENEELPNKYIDVIDEEIDFQCSVQLSNLKVELEKTLDKSNYYEYNAELVNDEIVFNEYTCKEFNDRIFEHFKRIIEEELNKTVEIDDIKLEQDYHHEFANNMIIHFTGRKDSLTTINDYLTNKKDHKVLSIIGASGSGKTCLMAKAVSEAHYASTELIYRFIGANSKSSNIIPLLQGLCSQIAQAYNQTMEDISEEDNQEYNYNNYITLVHLFFKCLKLAKPEKPLILFLDALDQLTDTDEANVFLGLLQKLPVNVKIVVSALPENENRLHGSNIYHLPILSAANCKALLNIWLSSINRTLKVEQFRELLNRFIISGLPIYLKIAFEEAKTWHSYDKAISSLPVEVPEVLIRFFEEIERKHSPMLVKKAVSYILSGKDRGLTEKEVLDILACDNEYWSFFLQTTHFTHRGEVEKSGKLPIIVWSRLYLDLEPFLTERNYHGEIIIGFYHRQFDEILKKYYITDDKKIHEILAKYFFETPLFLDIDKKEANIRKCYEQPWQQSKGELWNEVTETLSDLTFIKAKCAVLMAFELLEDYNFLLYLLNENSENHSNVKSLSNYIGNLITFSNGKTRSLEIIQNNLRNSQIETDQIVDYYSRLDILNLFARFIKSNVYNFIKFHNNDHLVYQQALNFTQESFIVQRAEKELFKVNPPLIINKNKYSDTTGFQLIQRINCSNIKLNSVRFTPDFRLAITGGGMLANSVTLRIWDIKVGKCVRVLLSANINPCHEKIMEITSVDITPDGRIAISGGYDNIVRIWIVQTGECLHELKGPTGNYRIWDVGITPNGKLAVSANEDGTIQLWDVESGKCLDKFKAHSQCVKSLRISPDGKTLATGGWDNKLKIWDLVLKNCRMTLDYHNSHIPTTNFVTVDQFNEITKGKINSVAFTPDSLKAVVGCWNGEVIVWDIVNRECLYLLKSDDIDNINSVDITPDGKLAISGGIDKNVRVWDLLTGEEIRLLKGHEDRIWGVGIKADGTRAASVSSDGHMCIWDLTCTTDKVIERHNVRVSMLYVSQNYMSALSEGIGFIEWNLITGECSGKSFDDKEDKSNDRSTIIRKMLINKNSIESNREIKVNNHWVIDSSSIYHKSICNRLSVVFKQNGSIAIIDQNTCDSLRIFNNIFHFKPDKSIDRSESYDQFDVSADACMGVGCNYPGDGLIYIWSLADGKLLKIFNHYGEIRSQKFSPDGRILVSGGDYKVLVHDLVNDESITLFEDICDDINSVEFSQDGEYVFIASEDKTIRIWHLKSKECIAIYPSPYQASVIRSIGNGGIVAGFGNGNVELLKLLNFNMLPPIETPQRIWFFDQQKWSDSILIYCSYCGYEITLPQNIIDWIQHIPTNTDNGSPVCLRIPIAIFKDNRLTIECNNCKKNIHLNPFIIDNSFLRDNLKFDLAQKNLKNESRLHINNTTINLNYYKKEEDIISGEREKNKAKKNNNNNIKNEIDVLKINSEILYEKKLWVEAEASFRELLEKGFIEEDIEYKIAICMLNNDIYDEELIWVENLIQTIEANGRKAQANELKTMLMEKEKTNISNEIGLANYLLEKGRWEGALNHYIKLQKKGEMIKDIDYKIGLCLIHITCNTGETSFNEIQIIILKLKRQGDLNHANELECLVKETKAKILEMKKNDILKSKIFADELFKKKLWEAALSQYNNVIINNGKFEDIDYKMGLCLINAHINISEPDLIEIQRIIAELKKQRQYSQADELDIKLQKKLPKEKKKKRLIFWKK